MNPDLYHGDCLEVMPGLPDGSVDAVICDPPYGNMDTDGGRRLGINGWDVPLEPAAFLAECNRVLRMNGALVLFSQEPYTTRLVSEAHGNLPFSYRMTWLKDSFANPLGCKKAPVSYTEDVLVFFKQLNRHDVEAKHPLREYALKVLDHCGGSLKAVNVRLGHRRAEHFFYESTQFSLCTAQTYAQLCEVYGVDRQPWFRQFAEIEAVNTEYKRSQLANLSEAYPRTFNLPEGAKYKSNVLQYRKDYTGHHPTQKPVALMEDLVKTYTNAGDTVLDFTMGSGSTGVACANTGRRFIGIERDDKYFQTAKDRIEARLREAA